MPDTEEKNSAAAKVPHNQEVTFNNKIVSDSAALFPMDFFSDDLLVDPHLDIYYSNAEEKSNINSKHHSFSPSSEYVKPDPQLIFHEEVNLENLDNSASFLKYGNLGDENILSPIRSKPDSFQSYYENFIGEVNSPSKVERNKLDKYTSKNRNKPYFSPSYKDYTSVENYDSWNTVSDNELIKEDDMNAKFLDKGVNHVKQKISIFQALNRLREYDNFRDQVRILVVKYDSVNKLTLSRFSYTFIQIFVMLSSKIFF